MPIHYKRGGRKVSKKQFFDGIFDDLVKNAEKQVETRLQRVRDPKTGQPVELKKSRRGKETSWQVKGSPEAIEAAKKVIKEL